VTSGEFNGDGKADLAIASVSAAKVSVLLNSTPTDITSTWNGAIGNWTDNTKWAPNTYFPHNGNGALTFDAIVNSGTVTLNQNIGIQRLTLGGG
jgi:hypothetical protein